jgi:hypothetical protein
MIWQHKRNTSVCYCIVQGSQDKQSYCAGVTTAHTAGRYEHYKAMFPFEKFGCIKCQQQATVPLLTDKLEKSFSNENC